LYLTLEFDQNHFCVACYRVAATYRDPFDVICLFATKLVRTTSHQHRLVLRHQNVTGIIISKSSCGYRKHFIVQSSEFCPVIIFIFKGLSGLVFLYYSCNLNETLHDWSVFQKLSHILPLLVEWFIQSYGLGIKRVLAC
jgi:hypothetical protein